MDLFILSSIAISLLVILVAAWFFNTSKKRSKDNAADIQQRGRGVPARIPEGIPRRAQIARNQRLRARNAVGLAEGQHVREPLIENDSDNDRPADQPIPTPDFGDEKIGTKKRAKLEAKAEKKAQREMELKLREEKKKQDALNEDERRKKEEHEKQEEIKKEEAERIEREEKERRELEEYLQMKEAFSVEEEGFEDGEDNDKQNLLHDFINYLKENKIVILEDLATHFKLKTQAAIDRIQELQSQGLLTGVIDDRGKFIYISEDELNAVAKFITQRGRISISELAECSNDLINLTPVKVN